MGSAASGSSWRWRRPDSVVAVTLALEDLSRKRFRIEASLSDLQINVIRSVPNPFHIFEQHFLSTTVVELGGAAVGMTGDSLGYF
jgi:hypothetical protein